MIYSLKFLPSVLKEWKKLAPPIQKQFKNKLVEIQQNPHISANKLRNLKNAYKTKLKAIRYRLVYEVEDQEIVIYIIAIGKRKKDFIYAKAKERIK